MVRKTVVLLLVTGLLSVDAGCSTGTPRSTIVIGPDGFRTFTRGTAVLCTAGGAIPPLTGTLEGAHGAPEPVWLRGAGGAHLSVVWPDGFSVRFDPNPTLFDDRGAPVATQGDTIELGQVPAGGHSGSFDDPYIASGIVFNGCYPFVN